MSKDQNNHLEDKFNEAFNESLDGLSADRLDSVFKSAFEDFEATPSAHLWDNIERAMPPAADDKVFTSAFSNFEVEPSPQVWQEVSRKLPLNLVVRRHLVQLSRVAAVVVLLMFAMLIYGELRQANQLKTTSNEDKAYAKSDTPSQKDLQKLKETTSNADFNGLPKATPANISEKLAENALENSSNNKKGKTNRGVIRSSQQPVAHINYNGQTSQATTKSNDFSSDIQKGREAILLKNTNSNSKTASDDLLDELLNIEREARLLPSKTAQPIAQADIMPLESDINLMNIDIQPLAYSLQRGVAVSNALTGHGERSSIQRQAERTVRASEDQFLRTQLVDFNGFYVAAATQWSNSWIINSAINEELGSAVSHAIDFGRMFGAGAGYKFSPRTSVELGVNYSQQGQRYREILDNKRVTDINITYLQIPIVFKYRSRYLGNHKPTSISYVAGIQYGRALAEPVLTATMNGTPVETPVLSDGLLVQNELGLVLGIDYDFYLNQNWSFSIGGRANIGTEMSNMFAANNAYNGLLGLRLATNYRFTK